MFEPIIWSIVVLGGLGAVFGIMLGVASRKFAVKKDERVVAVRENLPGSKLRRLRISGLRRPCGRPCGRQSGGFWLCCFRRTTRKKLAGYSASP